MIFLDSSDPKEIQDISAWGIVNPRTDETIEEFNTAWANRDK